MLQSNEPIKIQRERRVRQRAVHRRLRRLRRRVGSLRRLLTIATVVALITLGAALYFALRPVQVTPEAVLLGQGRAGVKSVTVVERTPAEAPDPQADAQASDEPADTGERGRAAGSGEASYYGDELRGQPTASGESFNPEGFTAAHRTLPLGSRVRVTNLRNGESIIVRVNDRGPFVGDRVLDVSAGAARELGMLGSGTARVRMELLPSVRG